MFKDILLATIYSALKAYLGSGVYNRIAVGALQGSYTLLEGEADALAQYQADVEAAREWGRLARAELGL